MKTEDRLTALEFVITGIIRGKSGQDLRDFIGSLPAPNHDVMTAISVYKKVIDDRSSAGNANTLFALSSLRGG